MTETTVVRQRSRPTPAPLADLPTTDEVVPDGPSEDNTPDVLFDASIARKDRSELAEVVAEIGKVHGPHVLRRANQKARFLHIPTDIFTLDMGLFGGIPQSLISMVYGWESSGKTTTAMRILAQAQKKYPEMEAVLLDAEGTYDGSWGATHGIDNDRLVLGQPDSGEQAVDIAAAVLQANNTSILVVDSLPALMPAKEMAKSAEDEIVALQARLIGRFVRKVSETLINQRKRSHVPAVLFINQFRNKIQLMGDPRTLPGGNALKFFVSVRWEVKNKEKLGKDRFDNEVVDVNEHSWQITKNKLGNGLRNGEFEMIRNPDHPYGPGFIDDAKPVMLFAKKFGLLSGGGSSWYLDGVNDLSNTKPMRFGKMQDIADYLYSDLDFFDAFKRRLISMQRQNMGLEPDNWY